MAHLYGGLDGNDAPSSLFRIYTSRTPASFEEVVVTHQGDSTGDYQPSFVYDAPRDRFITSPPPAARTTHGACTAACA